MNEQQTRKPVIYVPTIDDLMMVTQGVLKSEGCPPGNLILYSTGNSFFPSVRIFTDLPNIDSSGHADTGANSKIMIAKTNRWISRERILDLTSGLKGYLNDDASVNELSQKEYDEVLTPWQNYMGREVIPRIKDSGIILKIED